MRLLSLKDLCILFISRQPSQVLRLPEELTRLLFVGLHTLSPIMQEVTICSYCHKRRPCTTHDIYGPCQAYTLKGTRCTNCAWQVGRKYCVTHDSRKRCSVLTCDKQSVTNGISECWFHYRSERCIERDYNQLLCPRKQYHQQRCIHHQLADNQQIHLKCSLPKCPFRRQFLGHCAVCRTSSKIKRANCRSHNWCYNHRKKLQFDRYHLRTRQSLSNKPIRKQLMLETYFKLCRIAL